MELANFLAIAVMHGPYSVVTKRSKLHCALACGEQPKCEDYEFNEATKDCSLYQHELHQFFEAEINNCSRYKKANYKCSRLGNDVTSVMSHCCTLPYTLNGELYYNCTVYPAFSNDIGCYHRNTRWVTCEQPDDYVAKYEETSTTVLSANPTVAVPLLTISGWILMQRKVTNGSVSFTQNWAEYRDGFGSAAGNDNYWLGLEKVYRFVQLGSASLRVEIQRDTGLWYSAEYSTFSISDEVGKYRLTVAGYSGDAGDALAAANIADWYANGRMFSTADSDNDACWCNCAAGSAAGWWFGWCSVSAINADATTAWTTGMPTSDVEASHMMLKLN